MTASLSEGIKNTSILSIILKILKAINDTDMSH